MNEDLLKEDFNQDERFKLKARFRKKREKKFEKDERFEKVFKDDIRSKSGPKIDPFGRPLDGTKFDEIYSSSEDEYEDKIPEKYEEDEKEVIEYGDESDRIAVVGCDWDNVTSDDLFVLFETIYRSINNNDFLKAVKRTAIYLSDIGEKMISQENESGPIIENKSDSIDEEEDDETRQESLRKYQKERSRYYYGIVELESVEKAKILYDELDGTEVSFAIDGLDLRFVPPSLEFPRPPISESFKIPDKYEPPSTSQSALRHSKVECKWDTTPAKRFKTLTKRFTEKELASLDLSEYLASDSEDEVTKDDIANYKKLVQDNLKSESEQEDVEEYDSDVSEEYEDKISATVGNFKISFGANVSNLTEEKLEIIEDNKKDKNMKKERAKRKKDKHVEEEVEGRHFDMRYLKSKKYGSKNQQPGFKSNFDDERLEKVFKDPKFSIDTTDPNFKKTEFNKKLLEEKTHRRF